MRFDGRNEPSADGKTSNYIARTPEEIQNIEDIIKNSVGYDLTRGDQIVVSAVKFDNEYARDELLQMRKSEKDKQLLEWIKYGVIALIGISFIAFLWYLANTVAKAMNPPVPAFEQFGMEEPIEEGFQRRCVRARKFLSV